MYSRILFESAFMPIVVFPESVGGAGKHGRARR